MEILLIKNGNNKLIINNFDYLDGSRIIAEERRDNGSLTDAIEYYYGAEGIAGFKHNGKVYLYEKNVQGDVRRIYERDGSGELTLKVRYIYDAWGNTSITPDSDRAIAVLNPFRYRSYYCDGQEGDSGLYYLESRYYDPKTGRFINADDIGQLNPETLNGLNLYAYCGNNPMMNIDPSGHAWWNWLISGLQIITGGILIATGVGAGLGAMLTAGGILGMVSNALGSVIGGGLGSIVNGWGAISTGISLLSFGSIGIIAGIGLMAVGGATMVMGGNEIVSGIIGKNYMRDWMGGGIYDGLYLGLNIASSVGTIAGRLGMRAAGTKTIGRHDPLKVTGQKPYARIKRGDNVTNFNGKGNAYWSNHYTSSPITFTPLGKHWHTSVGGDENHIYSYIKLLIKLIFGG